MNIHFVFLKPAFFQSVHSLLGFVYCVSIVDALHKLKEYLLLIRGKAILL